MVEWARYYYYNCAICNKFYIFKKKIHFLNNKFSKECSRLNGFRLIPPIFRLSHTFPKSGLKLPTTTRRDVRVASGAPVHLQPTLQCQLINGGAPPKP